MGTLREVLLQKLTSFFKRHDPQKLQSKKNKSLQYWLNLGLAQGIDALNAALFKKYGDFIDNPASNELLNINPEADRKVIKRKVELFYLKHDPSKLEKGTDIESIVEWTILYGIHRLNSKLEEKYGARLGDVKEQAGREKIKEFYRRQGVTKSEEDCDKLLQWGMKNSFSKLNGRLIEKYGRGFGDLETEKVVTELRDKLNRFYIVFDARQLEDNLKIDQLIQWTIQHGVDMLNQRLKQEYEADLSSVPEDLPKQLIPSARRRKLTVGENLEQEIGVAGGRTSSVQTGAQDRVTELKTFISFFYAKNDQEKLYDGGVSRLLGTLMKRGENYVNVGLRKTYKEDLKDIEVAYKNLHERLEYFYKIYDGEKLEGTIETIVGWGIVHGEQNLNDKLMKRYDDDLEGRGLKKRLRVFYEQVNETRTEVELTEIVSWTFRKGVAKLNKKMKKKYGKSLEDLFITEEHASEYGEVEQVGTVYSQSDQFSEVESIIEPEQFDEEEGHDSSEEDPFPERGPKSAMNSETNTHLEADLRKKLRVFYRKHDRKKLKNQQLLDGTIEYILLHGVDRFNEELLEKYGESLNSLAFTHRKKEQKLRELSFLTRSPDMPKQQKVGKTRRRASRNMSKTEDKIEMSGMLSFLNDSLQSF